MKRKIIMAFLVLFILSLVVLPPTSLPKALNHLKSYKEIKTTLNDMKDKKETEMQKIASKEVQVAPDATYDVNEIYSYLTSIDGSTVSRTSIVEIRDGQLVEIAEIQPGDTDSLSSAKMIMCDLAGDANKIINALEQKKFMYYSIEMSSNSQVRVVIMLKGGQSLVE